jgi:hypothetical protein
VHKEVSDELKCSPLDVVDGRANPREFGEVHR